MATTRPQGKVTHLPFDAAGDDATATGAHDGVTNLREDVVPGLVMAWQVLRGEGPPHAAACGG